MEEKIPNTAAKTFAVPIVKIRATARGTFKHQPVEPAQEIQHFSSSGGTGSFVYRMPTKK